MADIPAGIPRLDAIVRAEAERLAREFNAGHSVVIRRFGGVPEVWDDPARREWPAMLCDTFETLLRNLDRPESLDWAARALAGVVGVEVGDTAPSWTRRLSGPLVVQWRLSTPTGSHLFGDLNAHFTDQTAVIGISEHGPTALSQALAAVCRDG